MYNPDVKGFSTKKLIGRNAYLNVAVSGAIAQYVSIYTTLSLF